MRIIPDRFPNSGSVDVLTESVTISRPEYDRVSRQRASTAAACLLFDI
jgi:hypothetical protein